MSSSRPPLVAIGMVDDVWTVAIADRFGWVKAGTGDPLDDSVVAGWTQLHAVCGSGSSPHADDCTGCDGPSVVPCAADRVIGDWAYRDGKKIKHLVQPPADDTETEWGLLWKATGAVQEFESRADAELYVFRDETSLVRRSVGPWEATT